jgi:flagellar biosynthetic protein FliQ
MSGDWAIAMLDEMLWNSMLVAGPLLIAALVTGLVISVLQVATQIQEITLSYVPKLLVSAALLMLLGSWMIQHVAQFAVKLIATIPSLN